MFSLTTLVQKAQSFIDPSLTPTSPTSGLSKASLFRLQFRLPDTQSPLHEITAELTLPSSGISSSSADKVGSGVHYAGRLYLSESFLCFSTQPTSFAASASSSASSAFTG